MSEDKIENLQQVLNGHIGNGRKIVEAKTSRLTAPGENYGSIMLKLDVKLKNGDTDTEELNAVAKLIPEDEFTRKIFNIQVTYKNEVAMYNTIVPTLQDFQRENGVDTVIDYLPKFYGARLNLDGKSNLVDDNAALILENLNTSGYITVDRHLGFDVDTAKLILRNMAAFHAVPLALKLKKPEVFAKKVRQYLEVFKPFDPPKDGHLVFIEIFQESDKCIPFIPKVKQLYDKPRPEPETTVREPFATVTHGDMWVNNFMIKFDNGNPKESKIIDFQVCDYNSPAKDLFFFLFTSVRKADLEKNLDDLIKYYHNEFISHLEKLHCSTEPFSFDNFMEEIRIATFLEFQHVVGMTTFIVMGKKGGPSRQFNPDEPPDFERMKKNISYEAKEKICSMVHMCGTRGWL